MDGKDTVIVVDDFVKDIEPYEENAIAVIDDVIEDETALTVVSTDLTVVEDSNNDDKCSNIGNCKFCGQQMMLPYDSDDEENRDEAVTLKCDCDEAKEYQDEKHREEEREANRTLVEQMIDKLFKDEIADCDEDAELLTIIEGKIEFIKDVTSAIEKGVIKSATLEIKHGLKIAIKYNAKDKMVIERKDTSSRKVEI